MSSNQFSVGQRVRFNLKKGGENGTDFWYFGTVQGVRFGLTGLWAIGFEVHQFGPNEGSRYYMIQADLTESEKIEEDHGTSFDGSVTVAERLVEAVDR